MTCNDNGSKPAIAHTYIHTCTLCTKLSASLFSNFSSEECRIYDIHRDYHVCRVFCCFFFINFFNVSSVSLSLRRSVCGLVLLQLHQFVCLASHCVNKNKNIVHNLFILFWCMHLQHTYAYVCMYVCATCA